MLKVHLVILLIILSFLQGIGQENYTDSLRNVIADSPDDSTKVNLLLDLAANYYRTSASEAIALGEEARDLAIKINYQKGLGFAYKTIGLGYLYKNVPLDALLNWQQSLATFQAINHRRGIANILNNIGVIYYNQGDDEKALEYYLESLRVADEINDSLRIATCLVNIGAIYSNKKDTREMAFDYYLRGLPLSEALGDYDAMGTFSVNLGELYLLVYQDQDIMSRDTSLLTSALKYLEQALDAYKQSATGNVPYAVNAIGKAYAFKGEYSKAIDYHLQALELAESNDAKIEMAQALTELAKIKVIQKDYNQAVTYYKQAETLASSIELSNDLEYIYEGLANAFYAIHDYKNAYKNQRLLDSVKTKLYDASMVKKLQTQTLKYDVEKRQAQIENQELVIQRQKTVRNATVIVGFLILLLAIGLYSRYRFTRKTNKIIAFEKERSDKLLLNILPEETAEELKNKGSATPKYYKTVSVLFTDFKGFTKIAEKLTPAELVEELNNCFLEFDRIIDKHNLEKIKTIGDAYMCAGGIPIANDTNPVDIVHAGLEIKEYMENLKREREEAGQDYWELRIGIHTGAVIAGVVGKNKFAYDIWGDAVNTASRMESSGIPGKVNISGETYELVKDHFKCTHRGKIQAKNKGEIDMYIVEGLNGKPKDPTETAV